MSDKSESAKKPKPVPQRETSAFPNWGGIVLPAGILWGTLIGVLLGLYFGNILIGAALGAAFGVGIGVALLAAAFVKAAKHW